MNARHRVPLTTPFLEIPDAALALEVGRLFSFHGRSDMQHYVRMAMHLLTRGRGSEVEGLEKADLDFLGGWVWFRLNATRAVRFGLVGPPLIA
ncbi:MAG: hypothetical protein JWM27_4287 [Gemmatimonadetes bacterium]|nr:hypothetical protein [Gemmatimonadota bacterium]